ncbi:ARF guanine nucleotide exchange factor [Encephalitozoon intestinalis ATCC 50506]|uniref:ARF guanine nucleotide exchange factor n=1 Tax=Encephalitozoon intestinalis (strain ATCC 50506) TaxID=876142 RepID=E0S9P9_ENCIT|nr:ARF guanine nucleotide exchange factor [Encephalitozoon intestinalis ATCC 50506]ADM12434.1 ARF guanine nucleotide exchange factor [Encephalitozoon intestinalis ATCC 50506]UTX46269.1 putative transportin [Encephalitozoon intestinalis]
MDESKQKLEEVQILLNRLAASSNKEIRRILDGLPSCPTSKSILDTFCLLFSLGRYSNKELLCFLDAFQRFIPICRADLSEVGDKIVELKFTPSEKDTDLVILKYFEITNTIAESIQSESSRSVFSRYMFVLSNSVVSRGAQVEVLGRFREFLKKKKGLLKLFAARRMYRNIGCTEDLIINFSELLSDEEMVEVALECTTLRGFIIAKTRSRYLFQMYHNELPWWYVMGMHESLIPYLYYTFDGVGLYKNVSKEVYGRLDEQDIIRAMDEDMKSKISPDECDVLGNVSEHKNMADDEGMVGVKRDIRRFNETGCLKEMLEKYGEQMSFEFLRYFEETDLRRLGEFLCKLKNEPLLRMFAETFDFLDMDILDGLRIFLLSFHLSPEGQVIHRVVEAYADKYYLDNAGICTFMDMAKDKKTKEFVFNLSFSFLVLNTKFHNPNIKVKPTFKDYMKDFTPEEIPPSFGEEYLESMYQSIKKKPLEFPAKNQPGKEHYKVFKKVCKNLQEMESRESKLRIRLLEPELPEGLRICTACRMEAHRKLFSTDFKRFLFLDPKVFYQICSRLRMTHIFEEYLNAHKEDTQKFIESFVYYLGMEGKASLYATLLDVLARTDKQRSSGMLSDLGISFLKSSPGKDRVQQQYRDAYKELLNSEIPNVGLLCEGLCLFLSRDVSGGVSGEEEMASQKRRQRSIGFVKGVVVDILKRNISKVEDLSMLDDENIGVLLRECVETGNRKKFCHISKFVSEERLLFYFRQVLEESPGFLDDEILEVFKRISIYNENGFHCILLLQSNGVDMFDFVVTVKYESIVCRAINAHEGEDGDQSEQSRLEFSGKDTLNCYTVEEKYGESLSVPSNLFHFYVSSNSVLNQSKARSIHKSGCPLKEKLFNREEMDKRLIYMIKKADSMNSKDITNYALWIVNLLSSSLPLLSKFFVRNFGLLLTLKDQTMTNNFIKIFYSRICKVINGSELCCRCGYSYLDDVEKLIEMLLKYDLASEKDFEFYFKGKSEMIKSGRVKVGERGVQLVNSKEKNDGSENNSGEPGEVAVVGEPNIKTNPDFNL